MTIDEYLKFFGKLVIDRKEATFPQSMRPSNTSGDMAPDWDFEIGGLQSVKNAVEDMFGITQ